MCGAVPTFRKVDPSTVGSETMTKQDRQDRENLFSPFSACYAPGDMDVILREAREARSAVLVDMIVAGGSAVGHGVRRGLKAVRSFAQRPGVAA
jgi:hypothetical protein